LQKREVLSLEWKSEGVMDDESGEFMELVEEVPLKELTDAKVERYLLPTGPCTAADIDRGKL